jgi:polysaccharide export outer membrane protein
MGPAVVVLLLSLQDAHAPAPPTPPGDALATRDYRIGADDVLRITVYGLPDLSQEITVEPDGTFDFPLIGRVEVADRTPRELEAAIARRLADGFVRDPQVRVTIQVYRSKTVSVMGELSHPGTYPLTEGRSLVEILARAGPLLTSAGAEVVLLRRPGRTEAGQVIRIDLQRLQSGAPDQNPVLQPDDTVFVPKAPTVFVSGEVRQPGAYGVIPGMTVRQAISLAGGFAKTASRDKVRIVRRGEGRSSEITAGLEDVVLAGDTLVVEKRKRIFWQGARG